MPDQFGNDINPVEIDDGLAILRLRQMRSFAQANWGDFLTFIDQQISNSEKEALFVTFDQCGITATGVD